MTTTLRQAVENYIEWQRNHGAKFQSDAQKLRHFSRTMGHGIDCDALCRDAILAYLGGNGTLTRTRSGRYGTVASFYRYAISRGYASCSPLPSPDSEPRRPKSPRPYIYSHDELQRLFDAIDGTRQRAIQFDGDTFRALLLLLYGTGLRSGGGAEARNTGCRSTAGCADGTRCEVLPKSLGSGWTAAAPYPPQLCSTESKSSHVESRGIDVFWPIWMEVLCRTILWSTHSRICCVQLGFGIPARMSNPLGCTDCVTHSPYTE